MAVLASGAMLSLTAGATLASAAPRSATSASPLAYTALVPARIADTRCGASPVPSFCASEALPASNSTLTTVPAGGTITVAMPSTVPSTAQAVVLNVAAVDQPSSGFLTLWPAGQSMPVAANLNFGPAQSSYGVSNLVTVALGSASSTPAVSVFDGPSNGQSVDVVVDLEGFYAPLSGTAGEFTGESPTRIADSRCTVSAPPSFCSSESLPSANSTVVTLGPGATDTLTVAGVGGVPSTGAAAAVMNMAITDATAPSFLSVYPGSTRPQVANLNWTQGETLSNKVLVDLGPTGQVTLYNNAGTVDIVVDVDGWFSNASAGGSGSLFTPVSPTRLVDTRCGASPAPSFCASEALPSANTALSSLSGGQSLTAAVTGVDSVPSSATAAVFNVTDVQPQSGNFLTVYPGGAGAPVASDVNWVPADPYNVVPNASYAALGSGGQASVLNGPSNTGLTDVVVDLFGYFTPASATTATLLSNPTSLLANGTSTSTLTTTLSALGLGIPGIPVTLSGVPSVPGACGTLSPASGVTNTAGQFVSTYTSSTVPGTCTITSSLDGLTPSVPIGQTTSNPTATLGSTLSSLPANGTSTSTLTTTLSALGVGIPGVPVTLSGVPSVPGACGTFSPASGVTNTAGQFVSTYTSSTVPGTCTITSSLDGLTPSLPIGQTSGVSGATAMLASTLSSLTADGMSTSTITTTLSSLGAGVPGVPVSLSGVPSVPGACGTFSPASGVTDSAGQFVSTYTSSVVPGTCTITSSVDGLTPSLPITQGTGGLTASLGDTLATLLANGTSTSTITTTLTSLGTGVPGVPVTLSELPSLPGSCGTLVPASGVTNSAGQFVATYTSSTVPGTCTISSGLDGLLNSVNIVQL